MGIILLKLRFFLILVSILILEFARSVCSDRCFDNCKAFNWILNVNCVLLLSKS